MKNNDDHRYYVVCCNKQCAESGNIKKNTIKCSACRQNMRKLNLNMLNELFCLKANHCDGDCLLLHATKKHQSPPYISPCCDGSICSNQSCLFLHPNKKGNSWAVR